MSTSENVVEIVLCVPGPWVDRSELVERVAKESEGYLFAGSILMHIESGRGFELEFEEPDPRMLEAFQASGHHWREEPEMARISEHKSVVYIISKGGSADAATQAMDAANALLKAGGFAVKVESSGIAHRPNEWSEFCQYNYLFTAHSAYVIYVASDYFYSCGMHNLGLPEAIVEASSSDNPTQLIKEFTHYLFAESPVIQEGHTFSVGEGQPKYKIYPHAGVNYGENELFKNPYGTWELKPC